MGDGPSHGPQRTLENPVHVLLLLFRKQHSYQPGKLSRILYHLNSQAWSIGERTTERLLPNKNEVKVAWNCVHSLPKSE